MPNQPSKHDSNDQPELPNNVEDCHKVIRGLADRIAELEKQLSRRNRVVFGRKSAKVDSSLLTGTGKAIHSQTENELDIEKNRMNVVSQGAEIHVGALLDTGDRTLRHVQHLGHVGLRELPGAAKFFQRHSLKLVTHQLLVVRDGDGDAAHGLRGLVVYRQHGLDLLGD